MTRRRVVRAGSFPPFDRCADVAFAILQKRNGLASPIPSLSLQPDFPRVPAFDFRSPPSSAPSCRITFRPHHHARSLALSIPPPRYPSSSAPRTFFAFISLRHGPARRAPSLSSSSVVVAVVVVSISFRFRLRRPLKQRVRSPRLALSANPPVCPKLAREAAEPLVQPTRRLRLRRKVYRCPVIANVLCAQLVWGRLGQEKELRAVSTIALSAALLGSNVHESLHVSLEV